MYSDGLRIFAIIIVSSIISHLSIFIYVFSKYKYKKKMLFEQSYFLILDILILIPTALSMPLLRDLVDSQTLGIMFFTPILTMSVNAVFFTIMKYFGSEKGNW